MKASRDWFDPALVEAEIKDYTWHCNRHTFASRLAMVNVPIQTIAALLGHRTIQMTMRYAHLSQGHNQSAVDSIASFGQSTGNEEAKGHQSGHQNKKISRVAVKH